MLYADAECFFCMQLNSIKAEVCEGGEAAMHE